MGNDFVGGPIFSMMSEGRRNLVSFLNTIILRVKNGERKELVEELMNSSDKRASLGRLHELTDDEAVELLEDIINTMEFSPDKNIMLGTLDGNGDMMAVNLGVDPNTDLPDVRFKHADIGGPDNVPTKVKMVVIKTLLELMSKGRNSVVAWRATEILCGVDFSDTDGMEIHTVKL